MPVKKLPPGVSALAHALGSAGHAIGDTMMIGMHTDNETMKIQQQLRQAGMPGRLANDIARGLVYRPYRGRH